jgi:hypothetical protein
LDAAWAGVLNLVLTQPPHCDLVVPKDSYPHPLQAGFVQHFGDPKGQIADYRVSLSDGRGIHISEFSDSYVVHWDIVDPLINPLGHIAQDAPHHGRALVALAFLALLAGIAWLGS